MFFVFWEVSSAILDVGWVRRFLDCRRLGGTGLSFLFCGWYVVDAPMVAVWLRYDVLLCVILCVVGLAYTFNLPLKFQVSILEWMRPLVIVHGAQFTMSIVDSGGFRDTCVAACCLCAWRSSHDVWG